MKRWLCVIVFLGMAGGGSARADNLAVFIKLPGSCGPANDQTVGFQFDLATPVTVTGVCWADEMAISHEVGLFDPDGNIIGTTHQTVSNSDALVDGFRCKTITPTELPVGQGYIMAGFVGEDETHCIAFNVSQLVHPDLVYFDAMVGGVNGLFQRPTERSGALNGFYGINLLFAGACLDNGCGKLKRTRCKKGKILVKGKAVFGGQVGIDLDGDEVACIRGNNRGKFKVKIAATPGEHTVSACGRTRPVVCP